MRLKTVRKKLWCLGLAGMLLAGTPIMQPQPVQAQTKQQVATVRKTIDAAYKAEDVAFANYDIEGSMQNHASDYVGITKSGKRYTRQQVEQLTIAMLSNASEVSANTVIERVTLNGNRANVQIKTYSKMHLAGKDGKTRILAGTERRDDTWVKQGERWLRTQGKQLSSYITLDGKPVG